MHTAKLLYTVLFAICFVSLACASGEGYFYAESDWESNTSSMSYQDKAVLEFTLEDAGDYLLLASADLSGSSAGYAILARLQIDNSTYAEYSGEPGEQAYGEYFIAHKTLSLGAGEHTVKIQYAAESTSQTAHIRDARIVALKLADYEYAENESERELGETYESIAASTFEVPESGDYLIIASSEYRPASTSTSVFANTLIDNSSMLESLFEGRETQDYKPHFSAKVETLGAGNHTINLRGKSESGAKYMRRARITVFPLEGIFEYAYSASEAETTNGATSPDSKVGLNFTPAQEADYLLLSVGLIGGDATEGADYASYTETEIDGSAINTGQFAFRDDSDRHSLFTLKNVTLDASAHTFERTYWSGASSDPDASLANARLILFSPIQEPEPNVTWNVPTLDLGSAYVNEGEPSGSANVTSGMENTNVTVTCESGDCTVISDDWSDTTSMSNGQSLSAGFTCEDSTAGQYSAVFSVTSEEDGSADNINVSCEILQQEVAWEQATLDLGSAYLGEGEPSGSENVSSTGPNTNVTVSCESGDCSVIGNDWATVSMQDGQSFEANFTCDDSNAGQYSALFSVTSEEDGSADNINVSCEILQQEISWEQSTLGLGSGTQSAGNISGSKNISSTGPNTNVTVTCESGDCSAISDDWSDATSMSNGQSLAAGFTCSNSSTGNFSAVFSVISEEDASSGELTVSCEMLEDAEALSVSLVSPANGSVDTDGDVTFECSAVDGSGLSNATLYGSWALGGQEQGVVWIENNSLWKYNDSDVWPGTDWNGTSYDDSSWPSGYGLLGYDSSASEYINTTLEISGEAYTSYYFRREFSVTDASAVTEMNFTIDYDDGYVVFINGYEVNRSDNLVGVDETDHDAATTVYHNWYCDGGVCGDGSSPQLPTYTLTSGELEYLVDGTNTIAVVLKQTSSSTDAAFELRLFGAEQEYEWGAIETKNLSGTSDSAEFSVENLANGTYEWNCLAYNQSGGSAWAVENYSLNVEITPNQAPGSPTLVYPGDGALIASTSPTLEVIVSDPEGGNMNVSFYGRALPEGYMGAENWTLILVPDTQYYSASYPQIFTNQTQWILANKSANNIKLAMHAGDIVDTWNSETQWNNANASLSYLIESAIPYTPTAGDHDRQGQTPDGAMDYYYDYLPASRFNNNSWWGGDYNNNTNHYMLMTIEDEDYIFMGLDFCPSDDELEWANETLFNYSDRKAILATHAFMDDTGDYYGTMDCSRYDGDTTYMWEGLFKYHDNLQIIMCAHMHYVDGEYYKQETNINGVPVHILTSDYQTRENGGDGKLRIMEFDPNANSIYVYTYSPYTDSYETDGDSQFVLEYNMSGAGPEFVNIGNATNIANGSHATFTWEGLEANTTYEWYAVADDGKDSTQGETWSFNTTSNVSIVSWNTTSLDLGSGLVSGGALEGSAAVLSYNSNEEVTIECVSGNCSVISTDWTGTPDMQNGWEFEANFTCSDSTLGSHSAVFNLTSLNDTSPAQLTVSCEILPVSVSWNESSIDMGVGIQEEGDMEASAMLESAGSNTNVSVSCVSGNCTQITSDFSNGISLQDGQEFEVNFTCSNSTEGSFSATFNVVSDNDSTPAQIEVSCEIGGQINVSLDSPQNGSIEYGENVTFECSAADASGLSNATLYGSWVPSGETAIVWIENNSLWKYNDSDVWPGTDWNGTSYDDSSWPSGYGLLGYDSSATEYINTTLEISGEAYTSYYFRRQFSVTDASAVTEMNFTIDYDDGYVVFINGYEVNRSDNLIGVDETDHDAATTVYHNWYCDGGVCGDGSSPQLPTYTLTSGELEYLVDGTNTIAVVLKQTSSSTDAAFELRLFGAEQEYEWGAIETKNLSGTSDSTSFIVEGIENGTYEWNCLVYGSTGKSAFAEFNYSFTMDPEVSWGASSLDLGSGAQGEGALEGSATVLSLGGNTDVSVECVSGDCAAITEDWADSTDMENGWEFEANFTCSDSSVGNFSATFSLTSDEDAFADQLEVSCEITAGGGGEWWDEGFSKCVDITINNAGTTELVSFPAYVNVTYDSDMKADFSDLRFVNESCNSGGTALDYEIEYSDANHADTWVGLDSLPAEGKTISLYYGNPSAAPAHNPSGVWDSDYASIYHFNHTSGSALDTKGYLDASESISPDSNMDVMGLTGRADYFDGDDRLAVTDWSLGTSGDRPHTYCAWVSYTGTGDMLIVEDGARVAGDGLGTTGGSLRYGACVANEPYAADSNGTYNDGAWHMVCGVTTSTQMELYVDGEFESSVGQAPYPGSNNGGIGATNGNGNGVFDDNQDHYFTGYMDEMHLSFEERSADWINQSYNVVANQGSFVVFGSELSQG